MKENKKKKAGKAIVVEPELKSELYIESAAAHSDDGYYHLVALDSKGREIPGSEFRVGPRTYQRSYSDPKKFEVKKKA